MIFNNQNNIPASTSLIRFSDFQRMKTFALLVLVWIFGVDIEKRMARYLLVDLEAGQTIDKGSGNPIYK